MGYVDPEIKRKQRLYDGVKEYAGNMEKILLSFHVLLERLLEQQRFGADNSIVPSKAKSILKGPLLKPTRRKLTDFKKNFNGLDGNLREFLRFFNGFRREDSIDKEFSILYVNSKRWWERWDKNINKVNTFKNNLIRKLSVPSGDFYETCRNGNGINPSDVTELKNEINGFLSLIRTFK